MSVGKIVPSWSVPPKAFCELRSPRAQICSARRSAKGPRVLKLVTSCERNRKVDRKARKKATCLITPKSGIKGKTLLFKFERDGKFLMAGKFKKRPMSKYAVIENGTEVHMGSENHAAVILHTDDCRTFSVRLDEIYGKAVMDIHFDPKSEDKVATLCLYDPQEEPEQEVVKWQCWKFEEGKNFSLLDDTGRPCVVVESEEKYKIDIESVEDLDDLKTFAVAISTFITKL